MGNYKKHVLTLKGFGIEDGTIPFSLLKKIGEQLTRLAESTLLSYVEGNSMIKRGKTPEWLSNAINFNLKGIGKGSTTLDIEAPILSESIGNIQLPFFQDFSIDKLKDSSALDLSFFAYEQAMYNKEHSHLLDKNLLKEIINLNKILSSENAEIIFTSKNKKVEVTKATLSKIKALEEKTPESLRTKVSGKLDTLKHSNAQLEIITDKKKITAKLSEDLAFNDVIEFFGKAVVVIGIANFNPAGKMNSFEITSIQQADSDDDYFRKMPQPIFQEFDLKRIAKQQNYKGTDLGKLLGKWPGDESTDELLEMLT